MSAASRCTSLVSQSCIRWSASATAALLTVGLVGSLCVSPALAGPPPTKPILTIETGMHTAAVTSIASDRNNRYLVTASLDKTARVWEVAPDGKLNLLRTLRPPIADGREGMLYAVALSPDGNTVACAGWTGKEWDGTNCIYLFSRDTGQLRQRITGIPDAVFSLTYSPDGKTLVATFAGNGGFRAYDAESRREIGKDDGYGNLSRGADFDSAGRLVTTSDEGTVRLYDAKFKKITQRKLAGNDKPATVRFSPNGKKIAVGFAGAPKVAILSATDLSAVRELTSGSTDKDRERSLATVCWSADGQYLYAAGEARNGNDDFYLRRWSQGGEGSSTDLPAAHNAIGALMTLKQGVAYAAYDPAFGILSTDGSRIAEQTCPIARQGGALDSFRLAPNGQTVRFSYQPFGTAPALFGVTEQNLDTTTVAVSSGSLTPPQTESATLHLFDWQNSFKPRIGSAPLSLRQNEFSISAACSPDGRNALIGTNFNLRYYKSDGALQWSVPAHGETWYVNIAREGGKLAVAAFADGTVRWYRATDGKELLAFYPHADGKRWVAWTPTGYYDCSIGGEDLIGWHLNRSQDSAADFFLASQYKSQFRRADVIKQVLSTLDETEALRVANASLAVPVVKPVPVVAVENRQPPVVTIVSPSDAQEVTEKTVKVRFMLRTPADAPVTEVRGFIEGRRGLDFSKDAQNVGNASDGSAIRELTIEVPKGESKVAVIAYNKNAASAPAVVKVRYTPVAAPVVTSQPTVKSVPSVEEVATLPKLYILAIGVSKYSKPGVVTPLAFSAKDARDFAEVMKGQKGLLYRDVEVKVLADGDATCNNVRDGLEWVQKQTAARDVAMVFISGHGDLDNKQQYHLLTSDFDGSHWKTTAVSDTEIRETLSNIAGKAILFLDTCHSGGVDGSTRRKGRPADLKDLINDLAGAENGLVVFASSTGKQSSLEKDEWGNGAFTKALIEGIKGKADLTGRGKITISSLDTWLGDRVKELTDGAQTPTLAKPQTISDYPIAAIR